MSAKRLWLRRAAAAGVTLVLAVVLLETAAWLVLRRRVANALRIPEAVLYIVPDAELGWRPAPDRAFALDPEGERVFRTDARGWRRFEVDGAPPLVVIGDSFTHAVDVQDGAVYYDVLARELGLPVVALGVNGYGTTQEWLLARELRPELPRVRALLLQLHDNDIINNSVELEHRSWLNNNLMPRPYLSGEGELERADPRRWFERLALGRQLTRRQLAGRPDTIEAWIEGHDPAAEAMYRDALRVTGEALARLRAQFAGVPAFAFDACNVQKRMETDLERLAAEAGFEVLSVYPELEQLGAGAPIVGADGAHWNERGHQLCGELLARQLEGALR